MDKQEPRGLELNTLNVSWKTRWHVGDVIDISRVGKFTISDLENWYNLQNEINYGISSGVAGSNTIQQLDNRRCS